MVKLTPLENHLAYAGAFESPVMELWGAAGPILEGLLDALAEFGTQLNDMEVITSPARPLDYSVTFNFGPRARVELKLGGISAQVSNLVDEEVTTLASILAAAEGWLKSGVLSPAPKLSSHVATYSGHFDMEGTTASEFLAARSDLALDCLGRNRGSGIVYHGDLVEGKKRVQLSVDHSLVTEEALFLQFVMVTSEDAVDYGNFFADGQDLVVDALRELGLELPSS